MMYRQSCQPSCGLPAAASAGRWRGDGWAPGGAGRKVRLKFLYILRLFLWSHYATSIIFILGTPVLAIALLLLGLERFLHVGIFDPALGGDPVLFQHLFWFYSHPAVYIMILPAQAVVSELIIAFARRPPFGYTFIAFASVGIAVLGFFVWGHHMFVSSQSVYASMIFSFLACE
jgi:cytochrome c oxidase subunit 1